MLVRFLATLGATTVLVGGACSAAPDPAISHGPMLGAVSDDTAAIWLRTSLPAAVAIACRIADADEEEPLVAETRTMPDHDNTVIVRIGGLEPDTRYRYEVRVGGSHVTGSFHTTAPSWRDRAIRLVFGSCYKDKYNRMPAGQSVFTAMAKRRPECVVFLGDFPYTDQGRREEIAAGHREIRGLPGFRDLTASTPTYGIYDDHDFGPNDCDGTHPFVEEALAAFRDFWPNPSYGEEHTKGIFTSFVMGPVEVFLLDGRYHARQAEGTMLGRRQFAWLCHRLETSPCRYKLIVSGSPFERVKIDCWAGAPFLRERDELFAFIRSRKITGVLAISGDIHRSDVHRIPIGDGRFFHDFTAGALARDHTPPPDPDGRPPTMLHSYGVPGDNSMFGELDFHPASDREVAIVYRSWSATNGVVYEQVLAPADLGIAP